MAAILVVAHAPLAASLHAVAAHVYPDCSRRLTTLDVDPAAGREQVEAQVRAALEPHTGEVLVLVDVFGATPCNAAREIADGVRIRVVSGVNVPMLWRTLCYADLPLAELVARAVDGGTQGVMHVPPEHPRQTQASPVRHGQVEHHHQQ